MKLHLRGMMAMLLGGVLSTQGQASERGENSFEGFYYSLGLGQLHQINEACAELPRRFQTATEYDARSTAAGVTETRHAWLDECDNPLEVAVKTHGPKGDELTEYFFHAGRVVMLRKRRAAEIEDENARVPGDRFYYGLDGVILHLVMTEWTEDSVSFYKETLGPLPAETPEIARPGEAALAILRDLIAAGPAKRDPTALPDAKKYRLIMDSVSPNGRYALAFGLAEEKIDWEKYRDPRHGGYALPANSGVKEESIHNYVVELESGRIVGETGGHYFGTRARAEQAGTKPDGQPADARECVTVWSPDATGFVQTIYQGKDVEARAGLLTKVGQVAGTADLRQAARELAKNFAAGKKPKSAKEGASSEDSIFRGYEKQGEPTVDEDGHVSVIISNRAGLVQEDFSLEPTKTGVILRALHQGKETEPDAGMEPQFAEDARLAAANEQLQKEMRILEEMKQLKRLQQMKAQQQ